MEKAPARAKKADCTKNAPSKLLKKTDAAERTKPREKTKKDCLSAKNGLFRIPSPAPKGAVAFIAVLQEKKYKCEPF